MAQRSGFGNPSTIKWTSCLPRPLPLEKREKTSTYLSARSALRLTATSIASCSSAPSTTVM